jgi:sulfate transport system ATP-binding protein
MSIEVCNIRKSFGDFVALDDVSLTVRTGELVALLGPSGSGKTTLLRIIAGLEQPDPGSGEIRFYDQNVQRRGVGDRQVGFVFQHYALFRHMTVFENVAFGLRVRPRKVRPSNEAIQDRVHRLLQLVQLDTFSHRYPNQLSGGQRQRVALARALAIEPKLLLLDEPFGALDAKVRQELRRWLRRLHDEIHITSVFVTHDQEEALELADRVVVMDSGRIQQIGTPDEVFHSPSTEFVTTFLGQVNLFRGRVDDGKVHFANVALDAPEHADLPAQAVRVFVRPHEFDVDIHRGPEPSFRATVCRVHSAGPNARLELVAESGEQLVAEIPQERYRSHGIHPGSQVFLSPRDVKVFADDNEGAGRCESLRADTLHRREA